MELLKTLSKQELLEMYDYDYVGDFHEGLACVKKNGKQFHIKLDGTPAYKQIYDFVGDFSKRLARVIENGKEYYINQRGEMINIGRQMSTKKTFRIAFIISCSVSFILLAVLCLLILNRPEKNMLLYSILILCAEVLVTLQAYLLKTGDGRLIK